MDTKKGRKTTIQDLGDDLMVEIISWLPLKSIVLCLGDCKRWQSLINEGPFFLTNTINVAHYHDNDTYILLCHTRRGHRGGGTQVTELPFSINKSLDKSLFAQVYDSNCGVLASGPPIYDYGIFASCNGLLIFGVFIRLTKELHECYISNPWTTEYVPFERPSYPRPVAGWGLAFENNPTNSNSRNNKCCSSSSNINAALYKIVVVHHILEEDTYIFEVYSSDENRWQLIESAIKSCSQRLNNINAVYCRRVLYWRCCKKQALMFNLETETPDYLELPRDADNDHAMSHPFHKSKLVECHGQLHCIRISSGGSRLSIWKMSTTMSDGWLILHNVDLRGAVERSLDVLDPGHKIKKNLLLAFSPIDMNCEGDDKVLLDCVFFLDCNYCMIVSYDLKRAVFELIFNRDSCREVEFFRYTPTNKTISDR